MHCHLEIQLSSCLLQYTRQFPLDVLTLHDSVSFRQGTRDGQFIVDWNFSGPPHSLVIICRNISVLIEYNDFLNLAVVQTQSTTDRFDYIGRTAAMRPHDSVQQLVNVNNDDAGGCWCALYDPKAFDECRLVTLPQTSMLVNERCRCNGLRVHAVCGCNKVRLPGTGQSAHVIGGSRFTRPAPNSRGTLLNWDCWPQFNKTPIFAPTSNL